MDTLVNEAFNLFHIVTFDEDVCWSVALSIMAALSVHIM